MVTFVIVCKESLAQDLFVTSVAKVAQLFQYSAWF